MDIGSYKSYNTPSVPNPTSSLVHRTSSGGRRPPSCRLRRAHQEAAGLQSTKPPCHQGGRRRQPTPIPTPPNPIPTPPTPILGKTMTATATAATAARPRHEHAPRRKAAAHLQ